MTAIATIDLVETRRTRSFRRNRFAGPQASGRTLQIGPSAPAAAALEASVINPLVGDEWDALASKHEEATAFHSSAWARVLAETYGHRPVYLRFEQVGETAALLPLMEVASSITGKRGVSLPFSDLCPALTFRGGDNHSLDAKLRDITEARNWKYLELRGGHSPEQNLQGCPTFIGHSLDLTPGVDELERGTDSSVRRNLRKAARNDLQVRIADSKEAVSQYYELHERTRRRHGAPPQSRRFFVKLHEHMIARGLGFIALAYRASVPIAGAVFLHFGRNACYKYGASDEREQEFRANNLVMWEAIRHLAGAGFRSLHFGRTAPENQGLRRFKLAWGAEEEMIEYFRYSRASETWSATAPDRAARTEKIFRKLPLSVNRLIGTMVYPHLD